VILLSSFRILVIGSILGAAILDAITGRDRFANLGLNQLAADGVTEGDAFGMEFIAGFILMMVISSVLEPDWDARTRMGPGAVRIGAVVAAVHFMAVSMFAQHWVVYPMAEIGTWPMHIMTRHQANVTSDCELICNFTLDTHLASLFERESQPCSLVWTGRGHGRL
jgi:glycerol uptake facilitator-like aquaporin